MRLLDGDKRFRQVNPACLANWISRVCFFCGHGMSLGGLFVSFLGEQKPLRGEVLERSRRFVTGLCWWEDSRPASGLAGIFFRFATPRLIF